MKPMKWCIHLPNGNAILWARFGFGEGEGLFVHMKALRPDEDSLDANPLCFMLTSGTGKKSFQMVNVTSLI